MFVRQPDELAIEGAHTTTNLRSRSRFAVLGSQTQEFWPKRRRNWYLLT
jgi:hypothetical protein